MESQDAGARVEGAVLGGVFCEGPLGGIHPVGEDDCLWCVVAGTGGFGGERVVDVDCW